MIASHNSRCAAWAAFIAVCIATQFGMAAKVVAIHAPQQLVEVVAAPPHSRQHLHPPFGIGAALAPRAAARLPAKPFVHVVGQAHPGLVGGGENSGPKSGCASGGEPGRAWIGNRTRAKMPPFHASGAAAWLRSWRRRLGLRLVGQMDHGRNRPLPSLVEWAGHGSECRGRAPARGVGRESLTRGFGARPRMSMQRDRPLPRIQSAHGWEGSRGRGRAPSSWCRARKPGRVSNRAGLGEVAGTGPGSSSWGARGRKAPCSGGVQRAGEAPPLPSVLCNNTPLVPSDFRRESCQNS